MEIEEPDVNNNTEVMDITEELQTMTKETERMELDNDDGDYVVKEFDVYLSQKLASQLCLFQYPLRPAWIPFDNSQISDIRFKQKQFKLEMDFIVDKENKYYNVEHETDEIRKKYTHASQLVPLRTNYAIGVRKGDEIHLTPVTHVAQFRPSFAYLDEIDNKKKKKDDKEEEEEPTPVPMVEDESTQLKVQYKRKETPRAAAARKRAQEKQEEEDEPWTNLTFLESSEPESMNEFEGLFASKSNSKIGVEIPKTKYLNELNPLPQVEPWLAQAIELAVGADGFSLEAIKKMPLDKQLSALFHNAHVMHFSKIKEYATGAATNADLLSAIERVAVFVRGCWVVRSDVVCETARSRLIRDFLLVNLHENEFVKRQEFQQSVKLPPEAVETLLSKVAISTPNGWKLKLGPDSDFMNKHPEVVEKFDKLWSDRAKIIKENVANSLIKTEAAATKDGAPSKTSVASSSTTDAERFAGHTPKEQLDHFFLEMFRRYGVCNMSLLKQQFHIRQQEKNPANLLVQVNDDMFNKSLKALSGCIQSGYYLSTLSTPAIDKYRAVVLEVFRKHLSVKKSDIKDACMAALKEDIPQATYIKILRELAYCKGSSWIYKSGTGNDG